MKAHKMKFSIGKIKTILGTLPILGTVFVFVLTITDAISAFAGGTQ